MVVLCRSRLELQQHAISTKVGRKLKMLMKQHFRNGIIPKPESSERLQRFRTAVGLKRPNLQVFRRLGLLSPTASSNSSPHDRSELSGFGIISPKQPAPNWLS